MKVNITFYIDDVARLAIAHRYTEKNLQVTTM